MSTMKRLAPIVVVLLGVAAAPALSVGPYIPAPVDFELAPPTAAARTAGGAVVSQPLRAPKRFNLVGLRWRGRAHPDVALRARSADGPWSRWIPVGAHSQRGSDPVWFGDADLVQYRLSRAVPGLRLHFVNTLGTATAADRARTALRRAAHRATVAATRALAAVVPGGSAHAQAQQPAIRPRADWGADSCRPRSAPDYGEVRLAYVHHTVSANDYDALEAPAIVLSICRYHRDGQGWNDIGYNFVVDRFGTIWEGRAGGIDQAVVGAQAQGYNGQSTGVSVIGTHSSTPASEPALDAIAGLVRWKLPLHGQPTTGPVTVVSGGGGANRHPRGRQVTLDRVSGHRDTGTTECPGDALYAQLPDLRARVGDVRPQRARTRVAAGTSARMVAHGSRLVVRGSVTQITGDPVGGAPVELQSFDATTWRTLRRGTTGAGGTFAFSLRMGSSHTFRVRWRGDGARLPASSTPLPVSVRPLLSAARRAQRVAVGGLAELRGRIVPAKPRLLLAVLRRPGRARSSIRVPVTASRGRYVARYRLRAPGLYRFQVVFPGDARNASAGSPVVYVRAVRGPAPPPASAGGGSGSEAPGA